jgi:transposase
MVDTDTGAFLERTLAREGNAVQEFYAALEGPVVVGIEATGSMQWFLELLDELGIECRVGHPAKIRAAETRKRATGLANLATGSSPVGEDTITITAHVAGLSPRDSAGLLGWS